MALEKFSVFNTLNIFIDRLMVENKIKEQSTDPVEESSTMVIVTTVFTTKMLLGYQFPLMKREDRFILLINSTNTIGNETALELSVLRVLVCYVIDF